MPSDSGYKAAVHRTLSLWRETLATGRIKDENSQGNSQCVTATSRSASFIRKAIEADKADRQPRMV
jgi:hypothetical protein